MAKKEKRFVRTSVESTGFEENSVWVDRETAGNTPSVLRAAFMQSMLLLAPLLDREGKPIITTLLEEKE